MFSLDNNIVGYLAEEEFIVKKGFSNATKG
jgi:hypothetical protein